MIFQIESYRCVGPIKLGMSRDKVRTTLKVKCETFSKAGSKTLTDAFDALGVHVHYKNTDICNAVELFSPAAPIFQGQHLLTKPFIHLEKWIKSQDEFAEFDGSSIESNRLGIGIYAPLGYERPHDPPTSVIVFERGYYE
jgi:hypothetical protein